MSCRNLGVVRLLNHSSLHLNLICKGKSSINNPIKSSIHPPIHQTLVASLLGLLFFFHLQFPSPLQCLKPPKCSHWPFCQLFWWTPPKDPQIPSTCFLCTCKLWNDNTWNNNLTKSLSSHRHTKQPPKISGSEKLQTKVFSTRQDADKPHTERCYFMVTFKSISLDTRHETSKPLTNW